MQMQKIQPKVKVIQDKYKNDQEKVQLETARLYREAQVPLHPLFTPTPFASRPSFPLCGRAVTCWYLSCGRRGVPAATSVPVGHLQHFSCGHLQGDCCALLKAGSGHSPCHH